MPHQISVPAFRSPWLIFFLLLIYCTFMAGFRNNFQNHRRNSEQHLETQAAIRKPEQAL
jgi:hypothetical protein